jgi:CubicO group peptidase (beta-lactamase class C family)
MFKKMVAIVSFLACIGAGVDALEPNPIAPTEELHVDQLAGIDAVVTKALETFNIPGAAVGIVVDGKIILNKGYGVREQEKGLPVTDETLFAIGSCTKAFTTFLLGQLVDEGLMAWDDPVIKYIPEFRLQDTHATHHVTVRDLVTHRSGLPRHDLLWFNSPCSRSELMTRLQHLELSKDLREKYQYNNLMYMTAGIVIERVTGMPWEESVKQRIFAPLGMERSNCSIEEMQKSDNFSFPYTEKNGQTLKVPFRNLGNVAPAGGINASMSDMTKWLQAQLLGCPVVKKETLREMQTIQIADGAFPTESSYNLGYGLGWMIGVHKGHYSVRHGGGIDGFISDVVMLPQKGIGVAVLSNSSSAGGFFVISVVNTIIDQLLGDENTDWLGKMQEQATQMKAAVQTKKKEDAEKANALPSRPFQDYVGIYEHPGYGVVEVVLEEGHLMTVFNRISAKLFPQCYDHFKARSEEGIFDGEIATFSFVSNPSGEIGELHIPLESSVSPIVFRKQPATSLLATTYLQQFEGSFEGFSMSIETQLRGKQLMLMMPGQPPLELVPDKPLHFSAKGHVGYTVRFVQGSDGKVAEIVLASPHGIYNFTAKH